MKKNIFVGGIVWIVLVSICVVALSDKNQQPISCDNLTTTLLPEDVLHKTELQKSYALRFPVH